MRRKIVELLAVGEDQVYAEFGRSLASGAFETDPESEGRRRFPHFMKSVRKTICENKRICALLENDGYYDMAHAAAIVAEVLLDFADVSTYAAPSAAVLCVKFGLRRLCPDSDERQPG